jgi:phosphopantetheinyl transferase
MNATLTDVVLIHAARRPADGPGPAWHLRVLQALPYAKRIEIERRPPADRAASLDALALLCVGLDRVGDTTARLHDLRYGEHGAPRLTGGRAFSLAHSASRVACLVAADAAVAILGLDLEDLDDPAQVQPSRLARLRDWVATEAVLKAAGHGLREAGAVALEADLADAASAGSWRCATFHGDRYRVLETVLDPECVCAVATVGQVRPCLLAGTVDLAADLVSAAVERRLSLLP